MTVVVMAVDDNHSTVMVMRNHRMAEQENLPDKKEEQCHFVFHLAKDKQKNPIFVLMKLIIALLIPLIGLFGQKQHFADYVDTGVGVRDKNSNCVVGPMLPYGSINPSPQTYDGRSDGYNPSQPIRGFGQLHVSGTGWPTYGNFLISAQTGLETSPEGHDSAHSGEVMKPHYFATGLERYRIKAEVTPAHYSAIYRFTFPKSETSSIVFDAVHTIAGDIMPEVPKTAMAAKASIDPASGTVKMTLTVLEGWPEEPYTVHFAARISKKELSSCGTWKDSETHEGQNTITLGAGETDHIGAYCTFATEEGETVLLKVATSFVSCDKAGELLDEEIPGWNFEKTMEKAGKAWDKALSKVEVETDNEETRTVFYSGLYRFFTFAHDRSMDRAKGESTPYWDDNYAYWDTFRTVYPLLILIDEDAYRDNVKAVIDRFRQRGGIWDAFVAGTDRKTDQGGNNIDCILADGFVKGVQGIDWQEAYRIVKHNADSMRIGLASAGDNGAHRMYRTLGWIPTCPLSASQTLEFAYNDFCAYQIAKGLGYDADAGRYLSRSASWRNLWNPDLTSEGFRGFIDARNADGTFAGIDPAKYGGSWGTPFYEADSWTYSYYVPQDIPGLIEAMGGADAFVERLNYAYEHRHIDYSNEPGFLTTRAFTEAGRADLSSYWTHKLMSSKFTLKGYPDNDDTGSMGSWYAFCAMGLFPDAGQDFYYLNAPEFGRITVHLSNGRTLRIESNASPENVVIKSCTFNGEIVTDAKIRHDQLMRGGILKMELKPF